MAVMILGLVLFIGMHLVPIAPALRSRLLTRLGDQRYRALFSAIAAAGLLLIIAGYHMRAEHVQLFEPFPAARAAAPALVGIAFVLFGVANMRSHIRRTLRHPMLIGLMLWSGVHLLANGDRTGTILFGSLLAYSLVALISAIQRGAVKAFVPEWKYDVMGVVGGVVLAYLVMRFHPLVFGAGPIM